MKRLSLLGITTILVFGLLGCSNTEAPKQTDESSKPETEVVDKDDGKVGEMNLDTVNAFLNTSADLGPGSVANAVTIIPFSHIDGPKNNSDLYAFVNFQYQGRDFVKYQVSYVSCTCRPAAVNYWNTAYIELSLPTSKNVDDVIVRTISYDKDPSGHYAGGLWADSSPTPAGVTYETFKEEYIPFFSGKENSYIKTLDTMWDIDLAEYKTGEGREKFEIDTFTGSSVSANNIIRITNALLDHHSKNVFFE